MTGTRRRAAPPGSRRSEDPESSRAGSESQEEREWARGSRATVPIAEEELRELVDATAHGPGAPPEIGDMEAKPQLLVPLDKITWHKLDHQAGFLLSRVDGTLSYAELLTISGMPEQQARGILARLIQLDLIGPTS